MKAFSMPVFDPWSQETLAEDALTIAEFERTGEGIPFDEVVAWVKSWNTVSESPLTKQPKYRDLRKSK